jgi:hypothetical protein
MRHAVTPRRQKTYDSAFVAAGRRMDRYRRTARDSAQNGAMSRSRW